MNHFGSVVSSIEMSEGQESIWNSIYLFRWIVPSIVLIYALDVSILTKTSFDGNGVLQISKPASRCCSALSGDLVMCVFWSQAGDVLCEGDILDFRKAFFSVGRKTGVTRLSIQSASPLSSVLKTFLFLKKKLKKKKKKRHPCYRRRKGIKGWARSSLPISSQKV